MIVLCVLIQAVILMLAILSRIHFSKYKDKEKHTLLAGMADFLYQKIRGTTYIRAWKQEIRKLYVVSEQGEEAFLRKRVTQVITICIVVLFASSSFAEVLAWKEKKERTQELHTIVRADYDEEGKKEDIRLKLDDKIFTYSMEIEPREYTEEEFFEQANKEVKTLEGEILGDNPDFDHISTNLRLPEEDDKGIFSYSWISDNPEIVSSYGKVQLEEVSERAVVTLTLTISYLSYEMKQDFPMVVVNEPRGKGLIERVEEELLRVEQETRTNETIELPERFEEVEIALQGEEENQAYQCLVIGILISCMIFPFAKAKRKDALKKRDDTLEAQYPAFVNKLWLMLGTGMTIQAGIRQIISGMEKDVLLKRELEYAMHQIDAGCEEAWVYEDLGRRLQIPEYYQLMQNLSQHIRMGTKDLRNLMETEVQTALKKRHELAKKKGEEASTKLLFPMVILLALVMLIIVYPAMVGL